MNISISLLDSTNTWQQLYPAHLYDYKLSGFNCPTEDYSIGNVSDVELQFTTDIQPTASRDTSTLVGQVKVGNYYLYITNVVKINGALVKYQVTARTCPQLDEQLPASFFTPVANETLKQLFTRVTAGTPMSYTVDATWMNQAYKFNGSYGYEGLTRRQVLQWICQLMGINIPNALNDGTNTRPIRFGHRVITKTPILLTRSNIKSIDKAEYTVPTIDKIWMGTGSTDVGYSYGTGTNQMNLAYNPMINPDNFTDATQMSNIYTEVNYIGSYTPMKVVLFNQAETYNQFTDLADFLGAGDSLNNSRRQFFQFTDEDNTVYNCPIHRWEVNSEGVTLEGTGNSNRDFYNASIEGEISQAGKFNTLTRTLDATISEVGRKVGDDEIISKINQTAETITIQANRINLNGAATFNNNVVIDQNGYITAVGATLTNATFQVSSNNTNTPFIKLQNTRGDMYCECMVGRVLILNPSGYLSLTADSGKWTNLADATTPTILIDPDVGIKGGGGGESAQNPRFTLSNYIANPSLTLYANGATPPRTVLDVNNGLRFYDANGNTTAIYTPVKQVYFVVDSGDASTTGVNIRASAPSGTVIRKGYTGSIFKWISSNGNGWAQIQINPNTNGWIAESYGYTTTL